MKAKGIVFVNDESLPEVTVERACIAKGHQVYFLKTDKTILQVRITPKGFIKIDFDNYRSRTKEEVARDEH